MAREIQLTDLLDQITHAQQRMSRKNPHRALLGQCASALIQLANRLPGEPSPESPSDAEVSSDSV